MYCHNKYNDNDYYDYNCSCNAVVIVVVVVVVGECVSVNLSVAGLVVELNRSSVCRCS